MEEAKPLTPPASSSSKLSAASPSQNTRQQQRHHAGSGRSAAAMSRSRKFRQQQRHEQPFNSSSMFHAGLAGGGSASATNIVVDYVTHRASRLATTDLQLQHHPSMTTIAESDRNNYWSKDIPVAATIAEPSRVGFVALFSFSTFSERICMIFGLIMAGIAGLAMPVWLLLLAQSLQTFNNIGKIIASGGDISILRDEMYKLIYSFAVVGAVTLISGTCYVALWSYAGARQTLRIRQLFVKSALRQEPAWFDAKGDPQELPTLAANALSHISTAIGPAVGDTFANILSSLGCLAVSIMLDPPLALFMICMLPVIAACIGVVSCFMRRRSAMALGQYAAAGAFATEVMTGIKTVASLCAESWAISEYTKFATAAQTHSVYAQYLSKLAAGIMGFLFYATYTFAFAFGTEQVAQTAAVEASKRIPLACIFQDCGISGSEVMVCIYGIILCAQFVALTSPGMNAIHLGRSAAVEIFGAIRRTPALQANSDDGGIRLSEDYDGSLEFKRVAFCYPSRPRDLIFANFNLRIEPGSAVALVGPSGSGKSTLSKLLLRFYDPVGGQVLLGHGRNGGVPLTELNLKWWRSKIGYVPQEPTLFPGTIRDNIAAGKRTVSDQAATNQEVMEAAKAASAHEFIQDLPDGYDTFYSGSSIQLSGGQIQRIAIARALIRNPSILLLDEATSALDTASEAAVQAALARIRATRKLTTVTVAHRLTTIINSDQIAVLADGCVQELGTHRELVKLGGIYATLCEGQGLTADSADAAGDGPPATSADDKGEEEAQRDEEVHVETNTGAWRGSMNNVNKSPLGTDVDDVESAVVVKDSEDTIATDNVMLNKALSRLWEYNQPERGFAYLGYCGAILVGALPPCEGILFGFITGNFFTIDDADEMRDVNFALSLWFLLLAGISLAANVATGIGFGVSGYRLTGRLRVLVFTKIMRRAAGSWFDYPEHSTGELTTRLEEDANAVSNVTGYQQGQRVQVFASLIAGIVVSLSFSWQIGLIAVGCMPFVLGASLLQAKCATATDGPEQEEQGEGGGNNNNNTVSAATLLERGFHDIIVLQAYNLQDEVSGQYSAALQPAARRQKKQGLYNGLAFGCTQFAVFSTFALLFFAGIQLMVRGLVSFTDFFVALLAVMFAAFGAGQTNADFSSRQEGLLAAVRLFEVIDEPPDDDDPLSSVGTQPDAVEGTVTFEECHFAYPTRPNAPVYYARDGRNGFSLDIPSKQSVAFTGRSGCGKSTALQLLLRFYRVTRGAVKLDANNIEDLNLRWLRGNIGYVGQMPVLFHGTIRENILLGKPDATQEEIQRAAVAANAHHFITHLSKGYDTDIGAGGSLLSGGQKQRIAIARAIIKDPKILVLDEATSALDNESEKIVQAALDEMQASHPRTTLVVAHRLETVKNCDQIVVLDRGGVRERGSHEELLQLHDGLYRALWTKQGGGTKED